MKKVLSIVLAMVMVLSLAACSAPAATAEAPAATEAAKAEAPKAEAPAATEAAKAEAPAAAEFNPQDYPIGICHILRTHPVVQLMVGGFVDAAQKLGYPYYIYMVDDSDSAKAYQLGEAGIIQHGTKGMLLYDMDDSFAMYCKKWADQGIAVVSAHTAFDEADKDKYPGLLAWSACSAKLYGAEAADMIGAKIGGKGTVAVTEGGFNPTENAAAAAFIEEMGKKYPDVKCLEPQEEGYDTPTAIQIATAIVQANPDLVGAFSTTGAGASTWAGAIDNTGKDLVCIGMDYSEVNLDLIKEGKIYGCVAQPLYDAFYNAVENLDKYFRGEPFEWANTIDAPIITQENVDDYYELTAYVNGIMANL